MLLFPDGLVPEDIRSRITAKKRQDKVHELLMNYNTDKDKE